MRDWKTPIIGMAAAFAGVSAGFSANLIPATPVDVIIGMNAKILQKARGAFCNGCGLALVPATMHYFHFSICFLLVVLGTWVTNKFVVPRYVNDEYQVPAEINLEDFAVKSEESRGLKFAFFGLIASLAIVVFMAMGPLALLMLRQHCHAIY